MHVPIIQKDNRFYFILQLFCFEVLRFPKGVHMHEYIQPKETCTLTPNVTGKHAGDQSQTQKNTNTLFDYDSNIVHHSLVDYMKMESQST